MTLLGPLSVFLTSLLAIPLAYICNQLSTMKDPVAMLIIGAVVLVTVAATPYFLLRNKPQRTDNFFYVLSIFTFASVIDLVIALENDGLIANFMEFYLRDGEPYLKTAHGTMISYWDGIAHYAMYLMILAAQSWNQSYRDVGLYWAASIGHSMLILMPGIFMEIGFHIEGDTAWSNNLHINQIQQKDRYFDNVCNLLTGSHGMRWPCLLNLPYLVVPFYYGARFLLQGRAYEGRQVKEKTNIQHASLWRRPADIFFIIFFMAATCLAVLRFIAALGGSVQVAQQYRDQLEPYLADNAYPKVQMMVYLFYFLPYYVAAVYGLVWPENTWMLDLSLIHAGAAAQGQFAHIGSSFHYRTPYVHRVPQSGRARFLFWLINGSLFIVPQLFAYRCLNFPHFFSPKTVSSNKNENSVVHADPTKKLN